MNPETGGAWAKSALRRTWEAACARVGVRVSVYQGTKHARASEWRRLGVDDRTIAELLGHAPGSAATKLYARTQPQALVEVIRPRGARPGRGES